MAKLVCEQNEEPHIFYISDCEEKVFEVFDYYPMKFIRTRKLDEDVNSAVRLLERWFYKKLNRINLDILGYIVPVQVSDIIYIDTYKNEIKFHLKNNHELSIRGTLKEFVKMNIYTELIKINSGCIVNLNYVVQVKNRQIYLTNGLIFGITRGNERCVKKKYIVFKAGIK